MYPKLNAELTRKGLTLGAVSKRLGINALVLRLKMEYGSITFNEAKQIKAIIGTDLPLEVLFEEAV